MMEFHAKKLVETKWEDRAKLEIRKHLVQYLHSFPGVKEYRKELVTIESVDILSDILSRIRNQYGEFLDKDLEFINENAPR
jgi:tRNA-dihydrouridine synthase